MSLWSLSLMKMMIPVNKKLITWVAGFFLILPMGCCTQRSSLSLIEICSRENETEFQSVLNASEGAFAALYSDKNIIVTRSERGEIQTLNIVALDYSMDISLESGGAVSSCYDYNHYHVFYNGERVFKVIFPANNYSIKGDMTLLDFYSIYNLIEDELYTEKCYDLLLRHNLDEVKLIDMNIDEFILFNHQILLLSGITK